MENFILVWSKHVLDRVEKKSNYFTFYSISEKTLENCLGSNLTFIGHSLLNKLYVCINTYLASAHMDKIHISTNV